MVFAVPPPAGVNERVLVRLILSPPDVVVGGTVISTGDHAGLAAATAPVPPPPESVTVGAAVYPAPWLVTLKPTTTPPLTTGVATAGVVGVFPVAGVMVTVGEDE